jgi:hypothetical protein
MDRMVHVKPPKEANEKGKLWLLLKCLYGLKDASRQWYLKIADRLTQLGFKKSYYDGALFYLIKDGKLIGLVGLHVDDFLHSGNSHCCKVIMPQILNQFKVGKSESQEFMYTGSFLKQDDTGITIDQAAYINAIPSPKADAKRLMDMDKEMSQEELTDLRRVTGIINWSTRSTRPDLAFEMINLSTKFKGGKVKDLAQAYKVLAQLKKVTTTIKISMLGDFSQCQLWCYTDAAYRNLNDQVDSCGGYIIFIVNTEDGRCAPIDWRSNKIKRKVHSTLGAETLSLNIGLDAVIGISKQISEMTAGKVVLQIKIITDNKSARDAVYSESNLTERVLRGDIAIIQEMIEERVIEEIRWVDGKFMLADALTKRGGKGPMLMKVLQEGRLEQETLQLIK